MAEPAAKRFDETSSTEDISYGILIEELKATAAILESDLEKVMRLHGEERTRRVFVRTASLLAVFLLLTVIILVFSVFSGLYFIYDFFVPLFYFCGALGIGLAVSFISLQEKRKTASKEHALLIWKHLAAKLDLADELLARTAAWLDRARIPNVERSLIRLYFEHLSQIVAEGRESTTNLKS